MYQSRSMTTVPEPLSADLMIMSLRLLSILQACRSRVVTCTAQSFIKDTTHFLSKLEQLGQLPANFRRKDGGEYEPSSLRSLLASVERHLKKNSYPASIFSDRQFELTRRCLQSKQKELKKAGRGNKDKAAAPPPPDRPRN